MIDGGLGALFQKHLPLVHWQRIETGMTGRGIPDLNFCFDGVEGWIENKITRAYAIAFKPEQVGWLLRRTRAGGRTFVAVRRMTFIYDELYLFPGSMAADLKTNGLPRKAVAFGHDGPAHWHWDLIFHRLIT